MYETTDKMVSHPSHYQTKNGLEVIDVIKAFTEDLQGIQATDTGNIIKYACRWNKKGTPIRDVEKIIWYATHLLEELRMEEIEKARKYTENWSPIMEREAADLIEARTIAINKSGTCCLLTKEDDE